MTISSINFQRVRGDKKQALDHIARTTEKEPEYLLEKSERKPNGFELLADVEKLHEEQMEIRKQNHSRGKAPNFNDSLWEAVINLEERHSLTDVKKVAEHIRRKYKLTPYAVAVHRDEGYTDKTTGKTKYNYHAHVMFYTVCEGKSQMRTVGKKGLSSMQTEVANILHMERGKENSKTVRLNHKQYRQVQKDKSQQQELFSTVAKLAIQQNEQLEKENKKLESELLSLKDQKKQIEEERKKYKEDGDHIAEDYRKLQALNKTLHTQEELDQALEKLRQEYEARLALKDKTITELQTKNTELNDTVNNLKNENSKLELELETKPKEVVKEVEKTVTVKRELTEIEIENLPRVQELNRTIKTLKENEKGLIIQKDYFDKAYNAELKIHQQLQTDYKTLQAENTELKDKLKTLSDFNRTVLDFIKAIHSDFDIKHPIPSLKKIYYDLKNRTQKSSITTLKRSTTNENTIERVEVLPSTQNRAMSVLEQKTTEEKKYRIMFGANECYMTAQDIRDWLTDYPEEHDSIAQQLSESDRREVFNENQKEQRHSPRVDHGFSR